MRELRWHQIPLAKAWIVCDRKGGLCDVAEGHTAGKAKASVMRRSGDHWPFIFAKMTARRRKEWDGLTIDQVHETMSDKDRGY